MVMTKSEALRILELRQGKIKYLIASTVFSNSLNLLCIMGFFGKYFLLVNDYNLCMSNSVKCIVLLLIAKECINSVLSKVISHYINYVHYTKSSDK